MKPGKDVYLVYETDLFLSKGSREFIGAFSTKNKAIKMVIHSIEIDLPYHFPYASYIKEDVLYDLERIQQVQTKNSAFVIETISVE